MGTNSFAKLRNHIREKLLQTFETEEAVLVCAENYGIDEIAAIPGISRKGAISIIKTMQDMEESAFFGSPKAEAAYQDVLERIKAFASTPYGRNRVELLVPLESEAAAKAHLNKVMSYRKLAEDHDTVALRKLLKRLKHFQKGKRDFCSTRLVIAENDELYGKLMKEGIGNAIRVATPGEIDGRELAESYELALYYYDVGTLDFGSLGNVVDVSSSEPLHKLVPQQTMARFRANRDTLEVVKATQELLSRPSVSEQLLAGLDSLGQEPAFLPAGELGHRVTALLEKMNPEIEKELASLELRGQEVIQSLSSQMPGRVTQIIQNHITEARTELKAELGMDCSPFSLAFPVTADDEEIERIERLLTEDRALKCYNREVALADDFRKLESPLLEEIASLFELDYQLTLGLFIKEYSLSPFSFSDHLNIHEGLHLELTKSLIIQKREEEGRRTLQRIDYHLGREEEGKVAILTGANSGGKTTLLEMIAQHLILAHLGLPVASRDCQLPFVSELILYSPEKALNAGAFESFLLSIIPILTARDRQRFILMDEIEAITELEAASRIISCFIDYLGRGNSFTIIVTHMAREILKNTRVRVDGIEARGLDENYQLIIDRTPRIGHFARSTPELIIRRLASTTTGREQEIFQDILGRFGEEALVKKGTMDEQ